MKTLPWLAALLLFTASLRAQILSNNPMKSRLDSVVDQAARRYISQNGRVGISIGITRPGGSLRYHYGQTAPASGELPTAKSVYEIGSMTKTFTALLVARAVSEHKLKLTDDVRLYLQQPLANLQYPNDVIKIGYLLTHTAQLPDTFSDASYLNTESFLEQLAQLKPDSLKSFRYSYSSIGYHLLGFVLERVYGAPYEQLVERYITGPLYMTGTRVNYPATSRSLLLTGYRATGQPAPSISAGLPAAGALRSTLDDMLKYAAYQLAEPDATVRLSHRILFGDVNQQATGFQWSIGKTWNWDYYLRTDGGTHGFRSFCSLYPDYQAGIVLLSNENDDTAGGDLYRLTVAILNGIKKDSRD